MRENVFHTAFQSIQKEYTAYNFRRCSWIRTGWHIRLWRTSCWRNYKSSVLAWPGQDRPGWNGTIILMSMGGSPQPDVSPCTVRVRMLPECKRIRDGLFGCSPSTSRKSTDAILRPIQSSEAQLRSLSVCQSVGRRGQGRISICSGGNEACCCWQTKDSQWNVALGIGLWKIVLYWT